MYLLQDFDKSFGVYDVQDEDMHLALKAVKPHYALTETQFFEFSVPEHDIFAVLYLWYHPALNVVSAGPMICQGVKTIALASELFDYRSYMPDRLLDGKLTSYTLDNGYALEMLEAGRTFRVRYDDPSRRNHFDVTYTAAADPVVWPGSKHFEQVMRTRGELTLRGKRYEIAGFNVRNRSWGETRLEDPMAGPPAGGFIGVFNEGFSFNVRGYDHPDLDPIWRGKFAMDGAKAHKYGWIVVDGERSPVKMARTVTHYDRVSLFPDSVDIEIVDLRDRTFNISGKIVAGLPFTPWLNTRSTVCLTRWECNEQIGWGGYSIQVQGNDFLHHFYARNQNL